MRPDIIIAVALLGAVIGAFIGEKIAPQFANHPVSYTIGFVAGAFIGLAVWAAWCVAGTLLTWLGILDDQDPDCTLPNDYFVYYTDCNDYTVQLLNGGHNILNTHWVVTSNAAALQDSITTGVNKFTQHHVHAVNPAFSVIITPYSYTCANNTLPNSFAVQFSPAAVVMLSPRFEFH
ncbi:MAG: hypothetical protein IPL65_14630 [Lewinellaceae bacterium]|nr:hypothetical protein [Lewinellaceae bacterium]